MKKPWTFLAAVLALVMVFSGGLYVGTFVGKPSTTTLTITTTSTYIPDCPYGATCGILNYSSSGHVEVLSAQASQRVCQECGGVNGQSYVYFSLLFENIGASPIYVFGGLLYCEPVNMTVPVNSILQPVTMSRFTCGGAVVEVAPGENYTVDAPFAGGGMIYYLAKPGQAQADFSFDWGLNDTAVFPYATNVTADFDFSNL